EGHDMGREIRLIRALADEGYQYQLNDGVPPIPRDSMVTFASLPKRLADRLQAEIEAAGVPVLLFRAATPAEDEPPDARRRWDLLLPASSAAAVTERFAGRRDALELEAASASPATATGGRG
ncbi:MAG TPA: hypothetical protein VNH13_01535, partial [Candidatus Acidoferrales bacterium]|nr:hypothetical protein [Candidatus Acidoferrales bacterium]